MAFSPLLRKILNFFLSFSRPNRTPSPTPRPPPLKNWQEKYEAHFRGEALRGIRLVAGGDLRALRSESGPETADGRARLKTDALRGADWILASYETVRDYQHSFAAIKCAAVVFDEMQKIKSPGALATYAAKSLNADFALGMTGTPVENRLADLWCILDAIEPGLLGDLRAFSAKYEGENEARLRELKALLTEKRERPDFAPVMLRRTRAENLPGLPEKTERKIPTPMLINGAVTGGVDNAELKGGGLGTAFGGRE